MNTKSTNKITVLFLFTVLIVVWVSAIPLISKSTNNDSSHILENTVPKLGQTQVATIKPDNDIATPWTTESPHWEKIDEADDINDPIDDEIVYAFYEDSGEIEIFTMENKIQFVKKVTKIEVTTCGGYMGLYQPKVSIYFNGKWTGWKTVNVPAFAGWITNTFNVEGYQSDLNNLQVRYKAKVGGSWPLPTFGSNSIRAFFCDVTYESDAVITDNCRPCGDIKTQWDTALPHWNKLDEYVIAPAEGDDNYIYAGYYDNNQIEEFQMDNNIQLMKNATKIQVKTYGYYIGVLQPQVSIFWNGEWQSWKTVNVPNGFMGIFGWATNTWNLEGDQKDVDNLRVRYKAKVKGFYPFYELGSNAINAFYCNITYEPGISICSPNHNSDYSETIVLDIEPEYLEDMYYVLNGVPEDLSGDTVIYIQESINPHTIQVFGTYYGVLYQSEEVQFYTHSAASNNGPEILDWGVDIIDAELAQGLGEGGNYIKVLVIDSGIEINHDDLSDNYVEGIDYVPNPDDYTPEDLYGHGTHVAGIIGALDNNIGTIGVAPRVSLYIARAGEYNDLWLSDIVNAIQWGIDHDVDIISMSFGDLDMATHWKTEFIDKINSAYTAGIILVAATGNDHANRICYPAKFNHVIAVGAINQSLQRPDFSNYGEYLDLVAPGVNISSPCTGLMDGHHLVDHDGIKNGYAICNGTSMACPMVSGVCALILSSWNSIYALQGGARVDAVLECLIQTANSECILGYNQNEHGAGLVDAFAAIEYAQLNF